MEQKGQKKTPVHRIGGKSPTWGQMTRRVNAEEREQQRDKMTYEQKVKHIEQKEKDGYNCIRERERLEKQHKIEVEKKKKGKKKSTEF